jgi:hypothetical protein
MVVSSVSDPTHDQDQAALRPEQREATLWQADGWTARIIKNEDDDGWAVEMTRDGELEPALVGPWTMGRDKKNPKPLDTHAFAVLVKAANEVRARHLQQQHAQLHRSVTVESADQRLRVDLDIEPDEDDPHAILTVHYPAGPIRTRVEASFKLSVDSARRFLASERHA